MPIDPALLRCPRCDDPLAPISIIERDNGMKTQGLSWAYIPVKSKWYWGVEATGSISTWRCPTCLEVRTFALTAAQMETLESSGIREAAQVSGAMSLADGAADGGLSLDRHDEDE